MGIIWNSSRQMCIICRMNEKHYGIVLYFFSAYSSSFFFSLLHILLHITCQVYEYEYSNIFPFFFSAMYKSKSVVWVEYYVYVCAIYSIYNSTIQYLLNLNNDECKTA